MTLVVDMALLLDAADTDAAKLHGCTCARSAIMNATLLLECTANSCLFSLSLPGKLMDELDKLPALSKLDYYLFATKGTHIDRGSRVVELAADVIRLRDHVVHPKPKTGKLTGEGKDRFVDYGTTKALGIPFDVREWDHAAAKKVAEAVLGFLSKFFLEWCSLTKGRITALLVLREKALIQGDVSSYIQMSAAEHAILQKRIPSALAFLDLRAPELL